MQLKLIGQWTDPLSKETHDSLIVQAIKRFDGCCAYCGVKMPMTVTHPHGGLSVCIRDVESSIELQNLIPLCGFCVNFNDIRKLQGLGTFIEMPWLTQSDINNLLRIVYCVQSSNDHYIKSSYIYQGASAIVEAIGRTPKQWSEFFFDGSVEKVIEAIDTSFGFFDKRKSDDILYIDRLRFFFHPQNFVEDIEFWRPTIESQILKVAANNC